MTTIRLPQQKKSYRAKSKDWRKDTMDAIDNGVSYRNNESVRRSIREKYIDSNLYDGKLDMTDMMSTVSSSGVLNAYVPKKIQHRPIIRPKIELLLGEASKDPFSWSVMVTDPASISSKQATKKKLIDEKITELLESNYSEEELAAKLKELDLYFKYTWKDLKEVRATKILKYFEQKLKLQDKFNENMLDKLVLGEEMIMFDIVGGTVEAFKLDPKKVSTLYSSDSNKVSDADVIIIEEYWSPGRIIDTYYDVLTPDEITRINDRSTADADSSTYEDGGIYTMGVDGILLDSMVTATEMGTNSNIHSGALTDSDGNIRVLRCMWRSQRLVKEIKGTDPETGEEYTKIMSEEYVINPMKAESAKKLWIGEWWQGSKIGGDIYKKVEPRPVQFNSLGNASKGHPGIVGYYNSVSGGKVVSFLSKMKPYQYLYDIVWDRLLDAFKKDLGNIVEMDMAKKPAGWKTEKWLHYAYKGGIMFVDSFKEATKGAATGKLAGQYNTTGRTISTSNGNYIQQHVNLLEYIKKEMGDIVGVTPQREGAVAASATVGTTERSVMASNNNTAYEFYMHEQFKLEALQVLLETAKVAMKGNKNLLQIVLEDFSIEMFDVDGDDFIDSDYAVFITTSKKSKDVEASLERYSQAFMQNGGGFSTVLDIIFSDSIAEKRRKIEVAEADLNQQKATSEQNAIKAEQAKTEAEMADKEADRALERYKTDADNQTKIQIETMKQRGAGAKLNVDSATKNADVQVEREKMQSNEAIARENKKTVQQ